MTTRPAAAATRFALAAIVVLGTAALGGCEQRAEPHPTYEAAPPPPPAPLAGAPDAAPTAAPPPGDASTDAGPATPSAAPPSTDVGPSPPMDQGLVAMAPIPNPEDGGPAPPRRERLVRAPAPHPTSALARYRAHRGHRMAATPLLARPVPRAPSHPAAPRNGAPRPNAAAAPRHAAAPGPHAQTSAHIAKPPIVAIPATRRHERRASRTELRQAAKPLANGTSAAAPADARTEALRAAAASAIAKGAVLTVPKLAGDQAGEVTLTVPAGFYDTLKQEAGRQAMGDAAASANLDATLSGDGYAIIPAGAQSQPLRVGQPTAFHWTVTAPAGAKGPLKADVSAELLGGGSQVLALGAVDAHDAGGAPKWWGAALLALVVALGLGWLARSRGADARIAASRKRARRPDGVVNGQRSLDLGPRDADPPR